MSSSDFSALLEKLKANPEFEQKLKSAASLDAALEIAKEAGFDVSKAEFVNYQAEQAQPLSDAELEAVAGGATPTGFSYVTCCPCK